MFDLQFAHVTLSCGHLLKSDLGSPEHRSGRWMLAATQDLSHVIEVIRSFGLLQRLLALQKQWRDIL